MVRKKAKHKRPKRIGKLGKATVYEDKFGAKFIYVHQYGRKNRVRDYTAV